VGKRWLTFLRNHRDAIAAMDFFTVPTITFGVLYCFFVISHERRQAEVRFDRFLDSVACIIATQWQRRRVVLHGNPFLIQDPLWRVI